MKKTFALAALLALFGCQAEPPPPPPPPPMPTGQNDVMTMLGVDDIAEMQSSFREEETINENGLIAEKRWYDAQDMLRLRKVYNYDEESFLSDTVFFDGNGMRLYTFRMRYDEGKNLIGEDLFNDKDELISSFTYDTPIPPTGGGLMPTASELLPTDPLSPTAHCIQIRPVARSVTVPSPLS